MSVFSTRDRTRANTHTRERQSTVRQVQRLIEKEKIDSLRETDRPTDRQTDNTQDDGRKQIR